MVNSALASEYFVSPSGDDSMNGLSLNQAWKSPSYAVQMAKAGDTIYLVNGTWYDEHIIFSSSGNEGDFITLTAYNGTPILDGVDKTGTAIDFKGNSYISIKNIVIQKYGIGLSTHGYSGTKGLYIADMQILHTSSSAIELSNYVSDSYIDNCTVSDNGWNSIAIYGTYGDVSDPNEYTHNVTVSNCNFLPPYGHSALDLFGDLVDIRIIGNVVNGGQMYYHTTPGSTNLANFLTITDNIVYNSPYYGIKMACNNSVFSNNTAYSNTQAGIGTYLFSSNLTFENNRVYDNAGGGFFVSGTDVRFISNYATNNTFVSSNYDYRVNAGKAVIQNPIGSTFKVAASYNATIDVEYNDGKVFSESGKSTPLYTSEGSFYKAYYEVVKFNAYPITSTPSVDNVIVEVGETNTDQPLGNTLVEFTASSTEGNNVDFTISELQPSATYMVKMDGYDFKEVVADEEGIISFSNDIWSEHTFTLIQTSESSTPVSSETGITFTPSATSLTATSGESTTFSVESGQEFTTAVWSLDGTEVESDTTEHVQSWTTAGTHTVSFDGTADAGTISRTWTAVVSEAAASEYSSISISPSATTVAPGESFSLDVYIDPAQALTGSQFDLQYSQLASVFTVNEGDLFTAGDLSTTFQYDSIDNAAGLLDNVYAAIVGSGSITSPGAMATIDMVAGSSSGVMDIGLSNVILSDANSDPAGYTVSNTTVLIDTAPQFVSVSSQTVEEEQSLSFTVSATDADGDDLTYTTTSIPSGATFNGGSLSWTPSEGDAGSYVASFEVTDGYLTDNVSVSITVTPMNHIPEISLFEPADGSTFEEGSTIDVNVAASDADGDSLSYILEIDGVQVSTSTSYSWAVDYESAGAHTIKVTVSDGIEEISSSSTITITDLQPRWDVNEDDVVNVLDITLVGQNYGKTYTEDLPRWDVNQDGTVNIQDLSIVSGHFGEKL
jgi:hypothetical protein